MSVASMRRRQQRFLRVRGRARTVTLTSAAGVRTGRSIAKTPLNYTPLAMEQQVTDQDVNGFRAEDKMYLLSAIDLEDLGIWPSATGWTLKDGDGVYEIVNVSPNKPGEDAINCMIHARGSGSTS